MSDIDCVINGQDCGPTLRQSIESVLSATATGAVNIVYVDRGSRDNSLEIAREFDIEVIELDRRATRGAARNAGWKKGTAPHVQFLDATLSLAADWFPQAVKGFTDNIGAVRGKHQELYPGKSKYNWFAELDANPEPGPCDVFGRCALIERSALEKVNGYDEQLTSGEYFELSQRLHKGGYKIVHLDLAMCSTDSGLEDFGKYWTWAYHTGFTLAGVAWHYPKDETNFTMSALRKLLIKGAGSLLLIVIALLGTLFLSTLWLLLLVVAAVGIMYPRIFHVDEISTEKNLTKSQAALYAWHLSFSIIPKSIGVLGFLFHRLFR